MRPGRLLAAHIAFWVSSSFALAVQAETPFEEAVQYALENLTSGISSATLIHGTRVTIMPTRTWKSVSGHYCRQYDMTVSNPGSAPEHGDGIRCRDGNGKWKRVKEK